MNSEQLRALWHAMPDQQEKYECIQTLAKFADDDELTNGEWKTLIALVRKLEARRAWLRYQTAARDNA